MLLEAGSSESDDSSNAIPSLSTADIVTHAQKLAKKLSKSCEAHGHYKCNLNNNIIITVYCNNRINYH